MIITSILFFIAFIPSGVYIATIYKYNNRHNNMVYLTDIVGASFSALLIMPLLNKYNPMTIILYMSILLLFISVLLASKYSMNKASSILSVLFIIFIMIQYSSHFTGELLIGDNNNKEMNRYLNNLDLNASIVDTRWSAIGRTDLVEFEELAENKLIFIDGVSGSRMFRFNGDLNDLSNPIYSVNSSVATFPLKFVKEKNILIIGAGGGFDVLNALVFDFDHVDAVEINPDAIDIVKKYSSYNGGIYSNYSNVHVYYDEGRSFLKRSTKSYDVIMLNIPVTQTIQGTTGYSLAENYLFTVDSFRDYLSHLNDDGYVVIVAHQGYEIYKLLSTIIKSLKDGDNTISQVMNQIFIIKNMEHPFFPTLILKKTQFSPTNVEHMSAASEENGVQVVYAPYFDPIIETNYDPIIVSLKKEDINLDEFIKEALTQFNLDLRPPTDDKPFFYKFNAGLPKILLPTLFTFSILSTIISLIYLQSRNQVIPSDNKKRSYVLYYFSSLGIGFMMIEIPLIQKFILFLGLPTLAISTIVFSLLLSMGVGGFLSKLWESPLELSKNSSLGVFIMALLYVYALQSILNILFGFELIIRLITSFFLIFPMGILMGILFPTGIRIMERFSLEEDIAWMWGFNSLFSVIGSILVLIINFSYGFKASLMLGGVIYLSISIVVNRNLR
jgi:spermidine synthase